MVSSHLNATQWDVIVGHHHIPRPGQYFLEVIVTMLCIKLKPATHFTKTRLVDHSQHKLTWDGVFSNVPLVHTQDERNIISHWYDARGDGTYLYGKDHPVLFGAALCHSEQCFSLISVLPHNICAGGG